MDNLLKQGENVFVKVTVGALNLIIRICIKFNILTFRKDSQYRKHIPQVTDFTMINKETRIYSQHLCETIIVNIMNGMFLCADFGFKYSFWIVKLFY